MATKQKTYEDIGGYPSPLIPKAQKEENSYGIAYARAMLSDHERQNTITRRKWRERIKTLRAMAEGTQDPSEQIDSMFDGDDSLYVNIDFSVPLIIPKFVDVLVNRVVKTNYYIDVEAPSSSSQSLKSAYKQYLLGEIKAYQDGLLLANELNLTPPPAPMFATPTDVEIHTLTDFKLSSEIAAIDGLQKVLLKSDYKETDKRVLRDLVTINLAGTKIEYTADGNIHERYVDVENLIYSFSADPSFRKAQHAGEIIVMTIAELREQSGFNEEIMYDIAKKVAGKNNNPERFARDARSSSYGADFYDYDTFQVTVLDFQFLSSCELVQKKKETNQGTRLDLVSDTYEIDEKNIGKETLKKNTYKSKYGGIYVIGTNYIYDYGEKTSPLRKYSTFFETELDYTLYGANWYKQDNTSFVERIVPFARQMVNAHLKIQHLVMKSRPNGLVIDVGGLSEIDVDGNGSFASPMKLISIYDQTGNLLYNGLDDDGETQKAPPVKELANGINYTALQSLIAVWNYNLQNMYAVTGLNEVSDASTPNSEMLVGVQQQALESSNNATFEIFLSWKSIRVRSCEKIVLALQFLARKFPDKFAKFIGEANAAILGQIGGFLDEEFNLDVQLEPTDQEKAYLEQNIQSAVNQGLLMPHDGYFVRQARNYKTAQIVLGMKAEQSRQRLRAEKQEDIKLNGEVQKDIAQSAESAKQATIAAEMRKALTILKAEHFSKKELLLLEKSFDGKMKQMENESRERQAASIAQAQIDKLLTSEDRKDKRDIKGKEMESELIEQRKKDTGPKKFSEESEDEALEMATETANELANFTVGSVR